MGLEIAAISAGVGLASSIGGTVGSFAQAGKMKRLQREADAKAEKMMAEARKKLDVNFYDELAINKEPYELQREALLQQGQAALQAGMEGEGRGAAATAGRVQMAMNQQQGNIRSTMGNELQALEQQSAEEDARLRDAQANLDLAEVTGAQMQSAEAQQRRETALAQGMKGVQNSLQMGVAAMPLYTTNNKAAQRALAKTGDPLGIIGNMSPKEFRTWKKNLTPEQRQQSFGSQEFNDFYQADIKNQFQMNPFYWDFMNPQQQTPTPKTTTTTTY